MKKKSKEAKIDYREGRKGKKVNKIKKSIINPFLLEMYHKSLNIN